MNALLADLSPKALAMLERSVQKTNFHGSSSQGADILLSVSRCLLNGRPMRAKAQQPPSSLTPLQKEIFAPLQPFLVVNPPFSKARGLIDRRFIDVLWQIVEDHLLAPELVAALSTAQRKAEQQQRERLSYDLKQLTGTLAANERALSSTKAPSNNYQREVEELCREVAPRLRRQIVEKGQLLLVELKKATPETRALRDLLEGTKGIAELEDAIAILNVAPKLRHVFAQLPPLVSRNHHLVNIEDCGPLTSLLKQQPDIAPFAAVLLHQRVGGQSATLFKLVQSLAKNTLGTEQETSKDACGLQSTSPLTAPFAEIGEFAFAMFESELEGALVWRNAAYAEIGFPQALEGVLNSLEDLSAAVAIEKHDKWALRLEKSRRALAAILREEFDLLISQMSVAMNARSIDDVLATASYKSALKSLRLLKLVRPLAHTVAMEAELEKTHQNLLRTLWQTNENYLQNSNGRPEQARAPTELKRERFLSFCENYLGTEKTEQMLTTTHIKHMFHN
ncbi:hypothetical protein [Polycladidibacter stylochi]|uniref:hypothetical protein n=1 Tax=Polycladidibacter stylochi TaxID=1807766 RepID=UPI0012E33549|nr:hypothetical protein [Pseudovibrio stylochi]